MHVVVYLPLALSAAFGCVAPGIARRLPPAAGTWLLSAGALLAAAGWLASLGLLGLSLVGQIPAFAERGHWSDPSLRHVDPIATPVAAAALAAVVVFTARMAWAGLRRLAAVRNAHGLAATLPAAGGDLVVVDDPAVDAYAVPGRPGRIVISSGLLRRLNATQRRAVLAHERAHLCRRHYLHHAAVHLAATANPLLLRLPAALALACERWADEDAAGCCRRDTVADALTRATASGRLPVPTVALAAAVADVATRVRALRAPAPRLALWRVAVLVGLLAAIVLTVAEATHDANRMFERAQYAYRLTSR